MDDAQEFVCVCAVHALSGRVISVNLRPTASVGDLREAVCRELALLDLGEQLLLCVDGASDAAPLVLEDRLPLAHFSLPHEEKEIFLFDVEQLRSGGVCSSVNEDFEEEEESLSSSSIFSPKEESYLSSSFRDKVSSQPLLSCLIATAHKVESKASRLQAVCKICDSSISQLQAGLSRAEAQDRSIDALACFVDAAFLAVSCATKVTVEESPWVAEATESFHEYEKELAELQEVECSDVNPDICDAAKADAFKLKAIDAIKECERTRAEVSQALTQIACLRGDAVHDNGDPADRRSVALDIVDKLRVTFATMQSTSESCERNLAAIQDLASAAFRVWDKVKVDVEQRTSGHEEDRVLFGSLSTAVMSNDDAERLLNRALDLEAEIASRKRAFGVHIREWHKLVIHQLRKLAVALAPADSQGGYGGALREHVTDLLQHLGCAVDDARNALRVLSCGPAAAAAEAWRRRAAATMLSEVALEWKRAFDSVCEDEAATRARFSAEWGPWLRECGRDELVEALLAPGGCPVSARLDVWPAEDLAALATVPQPPGGRIRGLAAEICAWRARCSPANGCSAFSFAVGELSELVAGTDVDGSGCDGFSCLSSSDLRGSDGPAAVAAWPESAVTESWLGATEHEGSSTAEQPAEARCDCNEAGCTDNGLKVAGSGQELERSEKEEGDDGSSHRALVAALQARIWSLEDAARRREADHAERTQRLEREVDEMRRREVDTATQVDGLARRVLELQQMQAGLAGASDEEPDEEEEEVPCGAVAGRALVTELQSLWCSAASQRLHAPPPTLDTGAAASAAAAGEVAAASPSPSRLTEGLQRAAGIIWYLCDELDNLEQHQSTSSTAAACP